jgi:hypothetical protein
MTRHIVETAPSRRVVRVESVKTIEVSDEEESKTKAYSGSTGNLSN